MTLALGKSADIVCVVTILLFVGAGLMDVATRTIPNALCGCVLALGFALHIADHTIAPALLGCGLVFALCFVAWGLGLFGGGDAKLLSAAALLVPADGIADLMLVTALSGGALSLVYIIASRLLPPVGTLAPVGRLGRILRAEKQRVLCRESLPYGVAIGCGSIFVLIRH